MNAAVDPALLQLVQQHVNALKIDLDKMAFELEGDRKVVKKALQDVKADLDQLEKRVSSTEQCVKKLQNEHSALTESVKQRLAQVEERISSAIPQISCGNKIIDVKFLCVTARSVKLLACTYWHLLLQFTLREIPNGNRATRDWSLFTFT